jgi:uncharacterized membrane-anchored protein YhcB (DUF1043 family)
MGTIGWLLLVAIGIALGFSAARLWPGSSAKLTEMERQRDLAREDVKNYRAEVSQHFERTAELFDKVTSDYRNLYEHLAMSARQLGAIPGESGRSVEARLAEPEQRRLGVTAGIAAGAVAAAAETPGDSELHADTFDESSVRLPRDYDEVPEAEPAEEAEPKDTQAGR